MKRFLVLGLLVPLAVAVVIAQSVNNITVRLDATADQYARDAWRLYNACATNQLFVFGSDTNALAFGNYLELASTNAAFAPRQIFSDFQSTVAARVSSASLAKQVQVLKDLQ